jgi:hypothetical protein
MPPDGAAGGAPLGRRDRTRGIVWSLVPLDAVIVVIATAHGYRGRAHVAHVADRNRHPGHEAVAETRAPT